MKALILAAGQGRRLSPLTDNCPKCLLPLGETTFIEFQIGMLRRAGVASIGVVTGFRADRVREVCGADLEYFHNPDFETTNSLFSFMQAADFAREGCLVLNSDVVFHPSLLDLVLADARSNVLLMDFHSHLGEEEMKVVCDGAGRVVRISKDIAPWDAEGENLGLVRLGEEGAWALMDVAHEASDKGHRNLWVPQGIARLLERVPFYAAPIGDRPWIEVDYCHDLRRAQEEIYPLCMKA